MVFRNIMLLRRPRQLSRAVRRHSPRGGKRLRTAISFWQMPGDEAALFEFLRSTGRLQARRNQSLRETEEIKFRPLSTFLRQDFGTLLICRKGDIEGLPMDRFKAQGQFWHSVDPKVTPVLSYSRERLDQRELFLSSLGASLDYIHLRSGERRQKDPDFKKWAKVVVAWVKARCTDTCELNGFDYAATPAVAKAVADHKIVLRV